MRLPDEEQLRKWELATAILLIVSLILSRI